MKISGYYIYNNVAIVACAIMSLLNVTSKISLSKVALLMPIILDDSISQKMRYQNYQTFDAIITQNQIYLSNFNNRYVDLLPQVVNGISLLLDLNLVRLQGEYVEVIDTEFYPTYIKSCDSKRLCVINDISTKLLGMLKDTDVAKEYSKLNIEL